MKLVKHLLDAKGRNVISISPDASVFDAIKLMADKALRGRYPVPSMGSERMPARSSGARALSWWASTCW